MTDVRYVDSGDFGMMAAALEVLLSLRRGAYPRHGSLIGFRQRRFVRALRAIWWRNPQISGFEDGRFEFKHDRFRRRRSSWRATLGDLAIGSVATMIYILAS